MSLSSSNPTHFVFHSKFQTYSLCLPFQTHQMRSLQKICYLTTVSTNGSSPTQVFLPTPSKLFVSRRAQFCVSGVYLYCSVTLSQRDFTSLSLHKFALFPLRRLISFSVQSTFIQGSSFSLSYLYNLGFVAQFLISLICVSLIAPIFH